jgi:hypothetical protein
MSVDSQSTQLHNDCGVTVSAMEGALLRQINVFNSSDIRGRNDSYNPDLGSPNEMCTPSGPGIGHGGTPGGPFSNCEPQGNLLVIQNPNIVNQSEPNDSPFGGCLKFDFDTEVDMINMGLLDVEEALNITVRLLWS